MGLGIGSPWELLAQGISDTINIGANLYGQYKEEELAKQLNAMQLDWDKSKFQKEIELANTAHQREAEDLKAAGINPLLTATKSGSAVPTAGSISPIMPDTSGYGKAGEIAGHGFANALQLMSMEKGLEQQAANIEKTKAEASAIKKDYEPGGIKETEVKAKKQEIEKTKKEALMIAAKTAFQEIENEIRNKDLKWYEADKIINYVLRVIPIAGLAGMIKSIGKQAVKTAVRAEARNAKNNPNLWKNDTGGKRYILREDGIVDAKTGEFHEWSGFD